MTPEKHTRSIHIDAPVEKVFQYVEDPEHFVGAMPEETHIVLTAADWTPEGVVTSYECRYRELGMHLTAVFTREEYVVNERIVDRSSMGPIFTLSVEAEDDGTKLTFSWDASVLMKMVDAVFFHGDKHVEQALKTFKAEAEALPVAGEATTDPGP